MVPLASRSWSGSEDGTSMVEVLIVAGLLAALAAISIPISASAIDATRARHAAGLVAGKFRAARHHAVMRGASVGVVFDEVDGAWVFRLCADGNRNGVRRTEIATLVDPCFEGPIRLSHQVAETAIAVDPALVGPGGEPGSPDPVRFGSSDLVSFSPTGTATGGTVFIRSARNVHYAIRVAGATARSRVLFHDAPAGLWRTT